MSLLGARTAVSLGFEPESHLGGSAISQFSGQDFFLFYNSSFFCFHEVRGTDDVPTVNEKLETT